MGIQKTITALCIWLLGQCVGAQPLYPQALPTPFQGTVPQKFCGRPDFGVLRKALSGLRALARDWLSKLNGTS